jgi:hypothetical protein
LIWLFLVLPWSGSRRVPHTPSLASGKSVSGFLLDKKRSYLWGKTAEILSMCAYKLCRYCSTHTLPLVPDTKHIRRLWRRSRRRVCLGWRRRWPTTTPSSTSTSSTGTLACSRRSSTITGIWHLFIRPLSLNYRSKNNL